MKKMTIVLGLIMMVGLLASCGERQETNHYYYSPAWTRGGQIIYVGALETIRKDFLGSQLGRSYSEYVQTIYPSGTGESSALFDVTSDPAYEMSCSPTGDYVGYLGGLDGGLFGTLTIRNIATGEHTGLEEVVMKFSPGISAFDWSSDGTKIVYIQADEIRMRDWNDYTGATDVLVVSIPTGIYLPLSSLSWLYGERIVFSTDAAPSSASVLIPLTALIYSDGTGQLNLPTAAFLSNPQILSANTQEVFGLSGTTFCSVDASVVSPVTTVVAASFSGILPRLSPDGTTAVYSKTGETTGIYLLNLTTGVETKLK